MLTAEEGIGWGRATVGGHDVATAAHRWGLPRSAPGSILDGCSSLAAPQRSAALNQSQSHCMEPPQEHKSAGLKGEEMAAPAGRCWESLGFCPQHDALWPELSCREHLELYARLKGQPDPAAAAAAMMRKLDLVLHAAKPSKDLSGGNKRKLSAAIALVAAPVVSFLDEPSSGMDVATRRNMWDVVTASLKTGSVVLTTHSMEEADALSTRIAIMTNGELRCVGTSQHLKTRFGGGYQLELLLAPDAPTEPAAEFVRATFGGDCPRPPGAVKRP